MYNEQFKQEDKEESTSKKSELGISEAINLEVSEHAAGGRSASPNLSANHHTAAYRDDHSNTTPIDEKSLREK